MILSVFVFLWGTPQVRAALDAVWSLKLAVPGLNELVQKLPPVVASPRIEPAVFNFNILSATGTGILLSALLAGVLLGYGARGLARAYAQTSLSRGLFAADHLLHAGHRLRHPLLGHGRNPRPRSRRHGPALPRCSEH